MIIKNLETLLSHGNLAGREIILDILQAGLAAPDPYDNVIKLVRVEGRRLIVEGPDLSDPPGQAPLVFDLDQVGHIYVVGGGKAAQRMAEGLEDVLGDLITAGQINAKKGDSVRLKRIPVTLAGHPLPDQDSVRGSQRIVEIERQARRGDIVFQIQSGGATALTALPAPGISLADLQQVYRVLYFERGANMLAANAVRNQLVVLQGRHPRHVGDATFIQLHTAEIPPDLKVHLYEPPKPDDAYAAAIEVLHDYHCWNEMPESVRAFLLQADPHYSPLRPEETQGKPHYYFRVMGPETMIEAARARAQAFGLNAAIVATSLNDVEAQPVAHTFAFMANEIERMSRPIQPPCVLICGGELVVTVGDAPGIGGRNQEFVLTTAPQIADSPNIVIASVDSEGTDGPTDKAGGIVDGLTMKRAGEAGLDLRHELVKHNSNGALETLGDAIHTGILPTNVRDLRLIYIGG